MRIKKLYIAGIFFLLSFIFWSAINLSDEFIVEVSVPLKIINYSKDYSIDAELPNEIQLKIKASGWDIIRTRLNNEKELKLKLTDYQNTPSLNLEELEPSDYNLFSSIKIMETKPGSIKLPQKRSAEKLVPVIPNLSIKYKEGFNIISKIDVSPEKITIRGTANILSKIDTIFTKEFELDEVSENVKLTLPLQDDLSNSLSVEKKSVDISFNVEQIVDKEFLTIPVEPESHSYDDNYEFIPASVNIKLRGGIKSLSNLDLTEIKVKLTIDKNNLDSLGYAKPQIQIPYGMQVISYEPELIKINFNK